MPSRWTEFMPVEELPEAPRNAKNHAEDELAASILRFGFVESITVDERTGRIVSGHGRKHELLRRQQTGESAPEGIEVDGDGRWLVPVSRGWASKDDAEADAFVIAANRLVERGGWHDDLLADVLADLARYEHGLDGVGYSGEDLNALLESLGRDVDVSAHQRHIGDPDDEDIPETPSEPVTRRGDIWCIGRHRVMCGDCRNADDVNLLLNGATINLAFTSPPYADRRKYDESSGFEPIHPDDYVEWFTPVAALVAEHLAGDGSWFVNIKAGADGLDTDLYVLDLVIAHVRQWGWHYATEFCWERMGVPKQPAMRFKNQFEAVYQFTRDRWKMRPENVRHPSDHAILPLGSGAGNTAWDGTGDRAGQGRGAFFKPEQLAKKRKSNADRQGDQDDEWFNGQYVNGWAYPGNRLPTFTGSHEATGHTAAFPVGLPAWFIKAYTDPDDTVYDPFLGSGSSALAAENEGRIGYGMELSAAYVDVALARWERKTGIKPILEATGEPHSFLTDIAVTPSS